MPLTRFNLLTIRHTPVSRLIRVGILTLLVVALLNLIPGPVKKGATIVINPANHLNQGGQTWSATLTIQSNQPVNSIDTTINFDPELAQVTKVDLDNSDYSMAVFKPEVNSDTGTIRLARTNLTPYQEDSHLATINFKGIAQGQMKLHPTNTQIIAHDGQGTDVYHPQLKQSLFQWLVNQVKQIGSK